MSSTQDHAKQRLREFIAENVDVLTFAFDWYDCRKAMPGGVGELRAVTADDLKIWNLVEMLLSFSTRSPGILLR